MTYVMFNMTEKTKKKTDVSERDDLNFSITEQKRNKMNHYFDSYNEICIYCVEFVMIVTVPHFNTLITKSEIHHNSFL